jgi:predicted porin
MKKMGVAAALLLMAGGAHAGSWGEEPEGSSLTLSGTIDLSLQYLKNSGEDASDTDMASGVMSASRLEFSGSEDLGGGNRAYFTFQPQFDASTGEGKEQMRLSYLGAKGAWGDVTLGRQDTPSSFVTGYADPSYGSEYSVMNNMQFFYAPYRVDNAIQYHSPDFGGLSGRVMYAFGEGGGTQAGHFMSVALEYYSHPLYVGFASERARNRDIDSPSDLRSTQDNYLSVVYSFDNGVEPTFMFHTYDGYYTYAPYVGFDTSGWDVQFGVRWDIDGRNRVHASYVHRNDDNNTDVGTANGVTLGYLYGLSKRTDLYVNYSYVNNNKSVSVPYPVTWSATPLQGQSPTAVAVGMRHKF